ncbi:MAG TPA: RNA polymerase factor sigma-54 [Flavobacteriaceae bacterium]|nr:RNA polymerase factor sigma-54 [Flavobacteriaceae bacterium]
MMKQYLKLKLNQKLSPQQIQLMKLIQLPTIDFEQKIKQELEENPALEIRDNSNEVLDEGFSNSDEDELNNETVDGGEIDIEDYLNYDDTPAYKLSYNTNNNSENSEIPFASGISFTEYLLNQLNTLSLNDDEAKIAKFLVGSIDNSGYLRQSADEIVDDLAFTQNINVSIEKLKRILSIVQQLDPPGVGAQSLQECLVLQLKRKRSNKQIDLANNIIINSFYQFSKKHFNKLIIKYNINKDELKAAIIEIEKLNPKPGNSYSNYGKPVEQIVPDFKIEITNNSLVLTLNNRNNPVLKISNHYNEMLKGYKLDKNKTKSQREAVQFIKQKLDSAKWFIDAVKQRQETLYVTMHAIMNYQEEYFLSGDEKQIKPMILKDIAEKIEMDISTISRVANSKYVDTPYGTKLLKEFFSESMTNRSGDEISTIEIKKILEKIIKNENKRAPETDERLVKLLHNKGYKIARRTVAKYREQLNIPVARLRKEI